MALWQYAFWVVPKSSVLKTNGHIEKYLTEEIFNSKSFFDENCSYDDFSKSITYMEKNKHWCDDASLYGEYDSDCIEIYYKDNTRHIDSIHIRIDLRKEYYKLTVDKLIRSILSSGFIIINEDLNVLPVSEESILDDIGKNKFLKFITE